jgi:hypothetical protein
MRLRFFLVLSTLALALIPCGRSQAVIQADQFVDSVGINIHLHYTDTLYANFPLIESSLQTLGVRHIRDGVATDSWRTYENELNALADIGIRGLYITSPSQTAAQIQAFEMLVPNSIEGLENPNEFDNSGATNWSTTLQKYAPMLQNAVNSGTYHPAIIGPSLVKPTSYSTLGSLAPYIKYGNIHDYKSWKNPGTPGSYGWGYSNYISTAWALSMESYTAPSLQVFATETGYTNATNTSNYVPESVAAVYMPRTLLEHYRTGIKRTYLYELLSTCGEDYGLLRSNGSRKPAFGAVANLLSLLSDPGPSFTTASLPVSIAGATSSVHTMLFEKRSGKYYLAIWVELPRYDGSKGVPGTSIPVNSVPLTITLGSAIQSASLYQWDTLGNASASSLAASRTLSVTATDRLMILELIP